jgi:transcriptional regulator with XRE-family HTH domain
MTTLEEVRARFARVLSSGGSTMNFGGHLQTLRETAGLSQSELAGKAGISIRSLQNWEIGRSQPRLESLPKLARALGVTVDTLVTPPPEQFPVPQRKAHTNKTQRSEAQREVINQQ